MSNEAAAGAPAMPVCERIILAGGVTKFGNDLPELNGCVNDAQAIVSAFERRGWTNSRRMMEFSKDYLQHDLVHIKKQGAGSKKADTIRVILYLSSHGFSHNGDVLLAVADSKFGEWETMISLKEIRKWLCQGLHEWTNRGVKSEVLVILDCCRRIYSGNTKGGGPEDELLRNQKEASRISRDLLAGRDDGDAAGGETSAVHFATWAACADGKVSWETKGDDGEYGGVFTRHLVACLGNPDHRHLLDLTDDLSARMAKEEEEQKGRPAQGWESGGTNPRFKLFPLDPPKPIESVPDPVSSPPPAPVPRGANGRPRHLLRKGVLGAAAVLVGAGAVGLALHGQKWLIKDDEGTVATNVVIAPDRRMPIVETIRHLFPDGSVTWKALGNAQKKEPRISSQPVAWVRVPAGATTAGLMFDRLINVAPPDWEQLQRKSLVIELACCVDSLTGGENKQLVRAELKNGYKKIREGIVLGVDEDLVVLRAMPTGSGLPESTVVDLSMANLLSNLGEDPGSRDPEVSLVVTLDGVAADVDLIIRAIYIR